MTSAVNLGRSKGGASPLLLKRKKGRGSVWMRRPPRRADVEGRVRVECSAYVKRQGGGQASGGELDDITCMSMV